MTVAKAVFDAQIQLGLAEEAASDALIEATGVNRNEPDTWPCDDVIFDNYDDSFEFHQVIEHWEPTPEMLQKFWALGFHRCWIKYKDGTERYYYANHI